MRHTWQRSRAFVANLKQCRNMFAHVDVFGANTLSHCAAQSRGLHPLEQLDILARKAGFQIHRDKERVNCMRNALNARNARNAWHRAPGTRLSAKRFGARSVSSNLRATRMQSLSQEPSCEFRSSDPAVASSGRTNLQLRCAVRRCRIKELSLQRARACPALFEWFRVAQSALSLSEVLCYLHQFPLQPLIQAQAALAEAG